MPNVIVTGAAGFIGSAVVRLLHGRGDKVVALDALTYSGRRENLSEFEGSGGFAFVEGSIADGACVAAVLNRYRPRAVLNLAAETHVDRSIGGPAAFVATNVNGVFELLGACLDYWNGLNGTEKSDFRFVQVSTDEVYGSISEGMANEDSPLRANSPYSATKAGGDLLVRAYHRTYGLPAIITRGSNAFGPRQFPEKLIPLLTLRGLSGLSLPIYGDGRNVREWIYVDDAAAGIVAALDGGAPGEVYNLGSPNAQENIDLAHKLCPLIDRFAREPAGATARRIEFVADRLGHDFRYAMDNSKALAQLGWRAEVPFEEGLEYTVNWYVANRTWWEPITRDHYDLGRLGSVATAGT